MAYALTAAVGAGILIALQAALLGPFGERLPAFVAATWIHLAGATFGVIGVVVTGGQFHLPGVRDFPVGLLAGVFGVLLVSAITVAVSPLGLAATLAILTGTQLLVAFGLEAAGILGDRVPLDPLRLVGAVLLVVGVVLIFGRR